MARTTLTVVGIVLCGISVSAEPKEWNWLASAGALCEGVGVHGAYRVFVKATVTPGDGDAVVVSGLSAKATSGIFTTTDETFSLAVSILENGNEMSRTIFGPQPPNSIGPAPAPTESRTRYALSKTSLRVPVGAKLRFHASASVPLDGGQCSLGSDTEDIDPRR